MISGDSVVKALADVWTSDNIESLILLPFFGFILFSFTVKLGDGMLYLNVRVQQWWHHQDPSLTKCLLWWAWRNPLNSVCAAKIKRCQLTLWYFPPTIVLLVHRYCEFEVALKASTTYSTPPPNMNHPAFFSPLVAFFYLCMSWPCGTNIHTKANDQMLVT